MPRGAIRLSVLLAALLGLVTAACAAPQRTPGAAQAFRLGAFTLVALRDAGNAVPNDGKVFGTDAGPAAVARILAAAGQPTDTLRLGVDALLVRMPGRIVLIDTGLGPGVHGALPESLAEAGISPRAITDVLLTHSHGDHMGGLLTADGTLAFPRATVRLSEREWRWMQSRPDARRTVKATADRVQPFDPGGRAEVVPGIRAIALYGHTPGHVGYEIRSGGKRLLDIGDSAHSAIVSLARPDWLNGYDADPATGRASRRAILARVAAEGEWVFAPHFPFPGIGRIVPARNGGYVWKPGLPR